MSGTDSASGETPNALARLSVSSALGVLLPDSYCAIRMSAVFSGKPTTCPKYFCVIPRRLRKKRILSPIAIAQHSFMYCATSIAYGFRLCQDSKSKKVKYFPASLLTIANSFSIMTIANSVKLFVDNRISVVRHGNGATARANRNAARKFSDTK